MLINHNIMAMTAYRHYAFNTAMVSRSIERLSTGYRINRAADDPAGLAISEKMRAQIRGLNMASRNCQDAISAIQTAEGALQGVQDMLQRMRELAVQAASDTNSLLDREALNKEYQELMKEINDTAQQSRFNDRTLLNGDFAGARAMTIQSGPNQGDELQIPIEEISSALLGLEGTNLLTRESAGEAIGTTDVALNMVSAQRASLGAVHKRLEHKIRNLDTMAENLQAAESRIRDVDIAAEMLLLVRYQILTQVSMAVLAQANALPQMVLQLLEQ